MLSTTTPDNCKETLYDDLLSLLSSKCVIRVVLSVSLLVSFFVMNFLRPIFSVCGSFRGMCQSGGMKCFERCFKVDDQDNFRTQMMPKRSLLFEDAMHQTAKLTSDTVEVKVLL